MTLTDIFGDTPQIRILYCLYHTELHGLSLTEIAKDIFMTRQTVSKHIKGLLDNNLVVIARRFGKTKLYRLDSSHELVKVLILYMSEEEVE